AGGLLYQTQATARANPQSESPLLASNPDEGQNTKDGVREAAIKALENFAVSKKDADRELAIKALIEFGNNLRNEDTHQPPESVYASFKQRVPFETGFSEFKDGSHIEIREVLGTQPRIKIGGQYLAQGKYRMPSDKGKLYFWQTATEAQYASGPILDLHI